jgi:hypothetical protein
MSHAVRIAAQQSDYQLGNRCFSGLSYTLSCEAGCPRVTVRYRSLPGLMARQSWAAPDRMALRPSVNPKIGELRGARQRPAERQRSRVRGAGGSGGWFEGDLVAEGFELADVSFLAAFGVDAGVVVAAAQVGIAGAEV